MTFSFFTIGHSTRPIGEFVDLLQQSAVRLVVDIRTVPRSRTNPQYNEDVLPGELAPFQIGYEHVAALGGLRGYKRDIPAAVNGYWENQSFHNYADYALSEEFHAGLERLRTLGHATPCAMMCAEAVWWRCHRRIVSDYLLAAGETVLHIMGGGRVEPARLTEAARPGPSGALVYPASPEGSRLP
ncbi:MAG TPA: DUF488 domain-containing protein [Pseudolabrys sp.]|nr:DUF488 domain-containing protein [Pseudolabrys sp.]